jgi:hypothetical protein
MDVAVASIKTHDEKSIYIKYEHGRSIHLFNRKNYITSSVIRSLQIDSEEKGPPGRPENSYPRTLSHG